MAKLPKSIAEIRLMEIEPEEIFYLVTELSERHNERDDVDFYTALAILAERYQDTPRRSFAVMERMRCLSALKGDKRMKGWTIKGTQPGCLLTNEAVFIATAKCRLKATTKRIWFDPDEFFAIVLTEAATEGRV